MEPCLASDPLEFVRCGGITNCGAACGVTTGGTDVADICRFSWRVSRLSGIWTESERRGTLPVLGGIAGGGPRDVVDIPTDPWDWTRVGRTGAFVLGGSELLTEAGRAGMFGFDAGWTVWTFVTMGGGCWGAGEAIMGLPTTVWSLFDGCWGRCWTVLGEDCGGIGSVWCLGDGCGDAGCFSCSIFEEPEGPNGNAFLFSWPAARYEKRHRTE